MITGKIYVLKFTLCIAETCCSQVYNHHSSINSEVKKKFPLLLHAHNKPFFQRCALLLLPFIFFSILSTFNHSSTRFFVILFQSCFSHFLLVFAHFYYFCAKSNRTRQCLGELNVSVQRSFIDLICLRCIASVELLQFLLFIRVFFSFFISFIEVNIFFLMFNCERI